jgi:hypothetical protein
MASPISVPWTSSGRLIASALVVRRAAIERLPGFKRWTTTPSGTAADCSASRYASVPLLVIRRTVEQCEQTAISRRISRSSATTFAPHMVQWIVNGMESCLPIELQSVEFYL